MGALDQPGGSYFLLTVRLAKCDVVIGSFARSRHRRLALSSVSKLTAPAFRENRSFEIGGQIDGRLLCEAEASCKPSHDGIDQSAGHEAGTFIGRRECALHRR